MRIRSGFRVRVWARTNVRVIARVGKNVKIMVRVTFKIRIRVKVRVRVWVFSSKGTTIHNDRSSRCWVNCSSSFTIVFPDTTVHMVAVTVNEGEGEWV